MAEQLTFKQFKELLERSTSPFSNIGDYVQFDPKSPIPKLIFRSDALLDDPDPEYNVDRVIYEFSRIKQNEIHSQTLELQSAKLKSVVAEGDSWFRLPSSFPAAIATRIKKNRRFKMHNIADWGHTLARIRKDRAHIEDIKKNKPDFFIFSAGGNDLQVGLAEQNTKNRYVHEYLELRKYDDYLTEAGANGIAEIGEGYKDILDEVTEEFRDLKVFCHGYDYPRIFPPKDENEIIEDEIEDEAKVEYIGQYLDFLGIPYGKMDAVIKPIVNLINETIKDVTDEYESVVFVNLRGVASIQEFDWIDDMHPDKDGFIALASEFEEAMSRPGLVV